MERLPEYLLNTLDADNVDIGFTLVITFSRNWCVEPFFKRFSTLKFDRRNCHLLFFDNSDDQFLLNNAMKYVQNMTKHYLSVRYFKTYRQGGSVIRGQRNDDFYKSKIFPISQMQLDIPEHVHTSAFVQLEDDELPQNPHTITRLLKNLSLSHVGISTGVSSARTPEGGHVGMGVHQLVEMQGDRIIKRICCSPKFQGVHEVQATGFYCFASYKSLWVKLLDDARNVASGLPHWAFDTWVTHRALHYNYKILADFDLWCDHIQIMPEGPFAFNQNRAAIDAYTYIPELNVYSYWQNSAPYGWVVNDDGINTDLSQKHRRNKRAAGTEVLQR